ncbi:MAG: hypothetical protein WAJ91_03340 [Rhodoplanes sp.]
MPSAAGGVVLRGFATLPMMGPAPGEPVGWAGRMQGSAAPAAGFARRAVI